MHYTKAAIILGNCLFNNHTLSINEKDVLTIMIESKDLSTHFKYHKHKIMLFLSAMRTHADSLKAKGINLIYEKIEDKENYTFFEKLQNCLISNPAIKEIETYDIEDKFFENLFVEFAKKNNIKLTIKNSPNFLTTKDEFRKYKESRKRLFMHEFYIWQRKRLNILMDNEGKPIGSKISFDEQNRKPLPKNITIPKKPQFPKTEKTKELEKIINKIFNEHSGDLNDFYLPTTRQDALIHLNNFLKYKFENFGTYEDAIESYDAFLFHSVLSPIINIGLLTPKEVIEKALYYYQENNISINNVEGFIRQIIGWREFIRGVYNTENFNLNFFNHKRHMKEEFFISKTGLVPWDFSHRKVKKYAYTHHIERLMCLGNVLMLCEISPNEVYKYFMEYFVDSSDWVMIPNVFGMSQFADGGIFATKPYICSSNYLMKMSNYPKGEWQEILDGLYWRFIDKKRDFFKTNPRMAMMVKMYDKMDKTKKERLSKRAEDFLNRMTY